MRRGFTVLSGEIFGRDDLPIVIRLCYLKFRSLYVCCMSMVFAISEYVKRQTLQKHYVGVGCRKTPGHKRVFGKPAINSTYIATQETATAIQFIQPKMAVPMRLSRELTELR